MPKRKHCDDGDKIERYKRKIRKLEEKSRQKETRKRVITYSSSDSEKNSDDEQPIKDVEAAESAEDLLPDDPAPAEDSANADSVEIPQLDPEILAALGESTQDTPNFGPKIHDSLAQLWLPILRKGLDKEVKEKLLKQFLIPENCPLLKAPKLNPEISAVVPEASKARDKRVETVQQQLGLGITALNKGLELLLDDGQNRLEAIKYLSDSCRLLCEVHFTETEARKKFVTPGLNKTFLNIVQDVERDEMLFSKKLPEKIKASKAIEKQGLQIKKPPPSNSKPNNPPTSQPSTSRSRQSGNWSSPRYSSNRGGRGGAKRTSAAGRGRGTPTATHSKQTNQSKQRATTQQQ
ncbi:uncharacterized protein LOC126376167 [Pectinophora gossypiella]|uniref:uncharacterized protein LOC126366303 n=1 Tax=Pectinophora gossypiella TaxID=13191 RepID=UPI00214EDF7E|nr:uncharacterized protein LOC126366303 [Pectinophora gossypiella]XP_049865354.1 uncharacterized protein LOC126366303 [Pectinophora gossypiella]XP_049873063.1 uncharacterized protein LOC126371751 [Pectinophora gossypiella]XP_049873064.1 uncharacterized protein LOC126371751 [Pectinophora gossypiella]XP_049879336.1 uncharacterized protein LOC126376167 [Pectinophora gossypiella]XP_049879338.1 uncharacterized protein LOC126376167 [Pectinophora gossypiella]